jgi:hypothetical protein
LPTKLAPHLAMMKNPRECKKLLETEINAALNALCDEAQAFLVLMTPNTFVISDALAALRDGHDC